MKFYFLRYKYQNYHHRHFNGGFEADDLNVFFKIIKANLKILDIITKFNDKCLEILKEYYVDRKSLRIVNSLDYNIIEVKLSKEITREMGIKIGSAVELEEIIKNCLLKKKIHFCYILLV